MRCAFAWDAEREINFLNSDSFKDIEEHGRPVKIECQGKVRLEAQAGP